ncbi:ATP-binding protein [Glaciihabitans sp. dw_435]|uniref:ATP-binding protein n=1 Tax=Glaciihabitans sp. dw_435 TaxID=2720081 RepID=UPI001BD22FC4|nr:ATP-binding protein [Glaciihabitans sp. dw_435]
MPPAPVPVDPPTVVLIDGRSGSGKTEFAQALVSLWPEAQLVRLDDIYPGWDGLQAASDIVHERILTDFSWVRWDWASSRYAETHLLDRTRPIVIEGCGALSVANRALAASALWVELDPATRRRRALERDGAMYAPHWDRWAAQEDAFYTRENSRSLADAEIDGADVAAAAARWRNAITAASMGE